ncbi:hypothetical protein [Streptomyces sp. NPDC020141]|uniref:hypothetical protein n=1 Tax=Streptomyces sp. NPDC020141 TaxID=3365065 RepID=UPI003791BB86
MKRSDQQGVASTYADATAGVVLLVVAGLTIAFNAWIVMLVLGALHGMASAVPAVGYGTAMILAVGASAATGMLGRAFRK